MRRLSVALAAAVPCFVMAGFGVPSLDQAVSKTSASSLGDSVSASSGYQITAQQGDSNVTLKISRSLMGASIRETGQDKATGLNEFTGNGFLGSLTVQAPASKSGSTTTLGTLDGLANSTTVELKLTNVVVTRMRHGTVRSNEYCKSTLFPKYLATHPKVKKEDLQCDSDFVKSNLPDDYDTYRAMGYSPDSTVWIWGINAKGGYKDFDYFQSPDLSKVTVRKSPWSAGAFASYAPPDVESIAIATFKVQQAYEDAKTKTLCPAVSTGAVVQCVSGPIGLPVEKRKQLLTLELRHRFTEGLAASLSGTRDFKNKVSGVALPIYFVGNGSGALTGGIRFDWSTDTHKTSVGLFIGQAFQLFD